MVTAAGHPPAGKRVVAEQAVEAPQGDNVAAIPHRQPRQAVPRRQLVAQRKALRQARRSVGGSRGGRHRDARQAPALDEGTLQLQIYQVPQAAADRLRRVMGGGGGGDGDGGLGLGGGGLQVGCAGVGARPVSAQFKRDMPSADAVCYRRLRSVAQAAQWGLH